MRKADLELLEMHLEPLRTAKDRHNETLNELARRVTSLTDQVKDHLRDADANDLAIKQALATVRSLIQRAHRLERSEADPDEPPPDPGVDNAPPPMNIREHRDTVIRTARQQRSGRTVL